MSQQLQHSGYEQLLREVPNYPKDGINFYDIDPLLNNADAFRAAINDMIPPNIEGQIDIVAGPEARGFIFAAAIATKIGAGVALLRKPGKLPAEKISVDYGLECVKTTTI
jgi:adenine phosphoribosyltransferase